MADPCFRSEAPTGSTSSKSCLIVMRVKRREKAEGGASIDTNESCQTKNCCPRSSCCVPWRFAISSWDRTCHDQRTCSVFSGFRPPFRSNSKAQSGRRPEATPESPRHLAQVLHHLGLQPCPRTTPSKTNFGTCFASNVLQFQSLKASTPAFDAEPWAPRIGIHNLHCSNNFTRKLPSIFG